MIFGDAGVDRKLLSNSRMHRSKEFCFNEELIGSKKWSVYHSDVLKYETGLSNKNRTIVLVRLIASEAIEVL